MLFNNANAMVDEYIEENVLEAIVAKDYRKISYNEIAKAVVNERCNGYVISENKLNVRDIKLAQFLYKFRFASESQLYRYSKIGCGNLKSNRIQILTNVYGLFNKVRVKGRDINSEYYFPDNGGIFLVSRYTNTDVNEPVDEDTSQKSIYDGLLRYDAKRILHDINIVDIYLDVFELNPKKINKIYNRLNIVKLKSKTDNTISIEENIDYEFKVDLALSITDDDIEEDEINMRSFDNHENIYFFQMLDIPNTKKQNNKVMKLVDNFTKFRNEEAMLNKYCLSISKKPNMIMVFNDVKKITEAKEMLEINKCDLSNIKLIYKDNIKSIFD